MSQISTSTGQPQLKLELELLLDELLEFDEALLRLDDELELLELLEFDELDELLEFDDLECDEDEDELSPEL